MKRDPVKIIETRRFLSRFFREFCGWSMQGAESNRIFTKPEADAAGARLVLSMTHARLEASVSGQWTKIAEAPLETVLLRLREDPWCEFRVSMILNQCGSCQPLEMEIRPGFRILSEEERASLEP